MVFLALAGTLSADELYISYSSAQGPVTVSVGDNGTYSITTRGDAAPYVANGPGDANQYLNDLGVDWSSSRAYHEPS